MKLLLDTHIWLWSHLEPDRLSKSLREAFESETNELWLSPLTLWEIMLLGLKGRIALSSPVHEWMKEALRRVPMREAPVTTDVVLATKEIHLSHADPVDQLLAATARAFDLTLVTADKRLLHGTGFSCLPNR